MRRTIFALGFVLLVPICAVAQNPDISDSRYRAEAWHLNYDQMARTPDSYIGKIVALRGKVVQVTESGDDIEWRIGTTRTLLGPSDIVLVDYARKSASEPRVLEGDIIQIYGGYVGLATYKSVGGASITLPHVVARFVDISIRGRDDVSDREALTPHVTTPRQVDPNQGGEIIWPPPYLPPPGWHIGQ
jgi:hypothetical protein